MHISAWVSAHPLENYSSLHEFSLTGWLGLDISWPKLQIQFDFNLNTPFHIDPNAYLVFRTLDADQPMDPKSCFSIIRITRWRIDVGSYESFNSFFDSLSGWHRHNYLDSQKIFYEHGCSVTFIEDDWTEYVDAMYPLYCNMAKRHGNQLYDISYFHKIAKQKNYKLLCGWHEGKMIAMSVVQEEPEVLHSTCGGLDYDHSSRSHAYSWLNFELIRIAIEAKMYCIVDVGLTGDHAKQNVGFKAIPTRIDIYAKNRLVHAFLKFCSSFISTTINEEGRLKIGSRGK